jgi:hypothetical protein
MAVLAAEAALRAPLAVKLDAVPKPRAQSAFGGD